MKVVRPGYVVPTAKQLRGVLLDRAYDKDVARVVSLIKNDTSMTIFSDVFWNEYNGQYASHVAHFSKHDNKPCVLSISRIEPEEQTAQEIADGINRVIGEVGAHRVSNVITGISSGMRSAWKMIEEKHPHIVCYASAGRAFNEIVKAIIAIPKHKATLEKVATMSDFVMGEYMFMTKFTELQKEVAGKGAKLRGLTCSFETRWEMQHTQLQRTLQNKAVHRLFAMEEMLTDVDEDDNIGPRDDYMSIVGDDAFWKSAEELDAILAPVLEIIANLETVASPLSGLYASFMTLIKLWENDVELSKLVLKHWQSISTPSLKFAYFLDPHHRGGAGMYVSPNREYDLADVLRLLPIHIVKRRNNVKCDLDAVRGDIKRFQDSACRPTPADLELLNSMTVATWWAIVGADCFSHLADLAATLFSTSIPASKATSDRIWSIHDFSIMKRRGLSRKRVLKLVRVSANLSIMEGGECFVDEYENDSEFGGSWE